jgi:hypothetical protein
MAKTVDINALGQAIDTSWGRSSTPQTASYSVKLSMRGTDLLVANYSAIVNFGTERQMIEMKRAYKEEGIAVTNAVIKNVKKIYKELTGTSLSVKEVESSDGLEIIGLGVYNPKRTAYFKRQAIFEIG